MKLLDRFFRRTREKLSFTPLERSRLEILQVESGPTEKDLRLSKEEFALTAFTVAEKREFYILRNIIKWLPSTVPGGVITAVSKAMADHGKNCSKQYAHSCLYPKNPCQLFQRRNINYKQIWAFTRQTVLNAIRPATNLERGAMAALNESSSRQNILKTLDVKEQDAVLMVTSQLQRDQYRASVTALETLAQGDTVVVTNANVTRIEYLTRKLKQYKIWCSIQKDTSTTPPIYIFTPTPNADEVKMYHGVFREWIDNEVLASDGIRLIGYNSRMAGSIPDKVYVKDMEMFGEIKKLYHVLPHASSAT